MIDTRMINPCIKGSPEYDLWDKYFAVGWNGDELDKPVGNLSSACLEGYEEGIRQHRIEISNEYLCKALLAKMFGKKRHEIVEGLDLSLRAWPQNKRALDLRSELID